MKINEYFMKLAEKVDEDYKIARAAREKGLDPATEVEIPLATSLAEKVVGILSTLYPQIKDERIVKRVLELEKKYGSLDPAVALVIAEEIAKEKYCKFESHLQAIEAGIRVALSYLTLGVVSSPIEGFVQLKIGKTRDGKDYFAPFYSGPIRSAGGTEAAFSLVVVDYLRKVFGYEKYDPEENEIKRGTHECYEYHERVTNLQYLPTEEEIDFLMSKLPIQVSGDPSEDREVYNYKDLDRVETNLIRSGFALVMGEGIAQKAPKIFKRIQKLKDQGFDLDSWDWMKDFLELQKKIKEGKSKEGGSAATYIKDIVAGRPIFGHPSRSGSFRLRYGRCRNTGYSTLAINPATMAITGDFIAVGTQLKIEKPTKGCTVASCDTIDGPIVKLRNGSVKYLDTYEDAKEILKDIEEIIYLGDILVPYGDFRNRNSVLGKPGFIEQYWLALIGEDLEDISFNQALELSRKKKVPLHPKYIYYWTQIEYEDFLSLLDWIGHAKVSDKKLILPYNNVDKERFKRGKRSLELIGCEHEVGLENVVLNEERSESLLFNLGIDLQKFEKEIEELLSKVSKESDVLDQVNSFCELEIKDKAGTFIGTRMGRPEKAKLRKLTGSPHVLFPVGNEGGRLRSVQAAVDVGSVKAEFPNFYCNKCKQSNIYSKCPECGNTCNKKFYCFRCQSEYDEKCPEHGIGSRFREQRLDIKKYFETAKKLVGVRIEELPAAIKGVRGTSSEDHDCENLAKGLLRAKYGLQVNKDGTVRYDITEMPLTHFRPAEIGTSVEKLRELGYEKDIFGRNLEKEDQLLEIFPHDIVLPACPDSSDERSDDVFYKVCKFIDEALEKIYGLDKYFDLKTKEDLVGNLFACIAPHICTAVVGRLIGFSKTQALLASPYMHAAMRRDCDGDEAAVMLLADTLINFSKKFLPAHRGGTQDAPLVLNSKINAGEVDDMIFDLDVDKNIPLKLYENAEKEEHPFSVEMEQVKDRLGGEKEFSDLWFSYDTKNINAGAVCSSYKTLPTMQEKVEQQMNLCEKIRAVETSDVARLVIERHFIRDIRGNFRKFSMQVFRCVGCNEKFRRPPLTGKCTRCGGKLIFTIHEGSILKYMQGALDLARKYGVSDYLLECLELAQKDIESIFGKEKEKQEALNKWF